MPPLRRLKSRLHSSRPAAATFFLVTIIATISTPARAADAAAAHPAVEVISFTSPAQAKLASRKSSYTFTVGTGDWTDAGFAVARGDVLEFTASGELTTTDGKTIPPAGVPRGWKDLMRAYPLNTADSGALIGRIGNTDAVVPFSVGANKTLNVMTNGELYLRVNLSSDLTATGEFQVKIKLSQKKIEEKLKPLNLATVLSPALFADVPRRVHDLEGNPGDMVNFALIGNEDQVKTAFAASGWLQVDKTTQDAVLHGLIATFSHEAYTQMPMSTLYLFGRSQDLSFARAAPLAVAAIRHHLRVWKTTQLVGGRPLWVGSATHDNGFERDQRNGGVTHHIDPDVDKERDFLEQSFADSGSIEGAAYVSPADALTAAKTATGGSFHSDGRIVVLELY
jgi:hypothetical protein